MMRRFLNDRAVNVIENRSARPQSALVLDVSGSMTAASAGGGEVREINDDGSVNDFNTLTWQNRP